MEHEERMARLLAERERASAARQGDVAPSSLEGYVSDPPAMPADAEGLGNKGT